MEGFVVDQVSKTYMDEKHQPFQVLHNVSFSWSLSLIHISEPTRPY